MKMKAGRKIPIKRSQSPPKFAQILCFITIFKGV